VDCVGLVLVVVSYWLHAVQLYKLHVIYLFVLVVYGGCRRWCCLGGISTCGVCGVLGWEGFGVSSG